MLSIYIPFFSNETYYFEGNVDHYIVDTINNNNNHNFEMKCAPFSNYHQYDILFSRKKGAYECCGFSLPVLKNDEDPFKTEHSIHSKRFRFLKKEKPFPEIEFVGTTFSRNGSRQTLKSEVGIYAIYIKEDKTPFYMSTLSMENYFIFYKDNPVSFFIFDLHHYIDGINTTIPGNLIKEDTKNITLLQDETSFEFFDGEQ